MTEPLPPLRELKALKELKEGKYSTVSTDFSMKPRFILDTNANAIDSTPIHDVCKPPQHFATAE
jgi:hypothetical protein